MPKIGREPLWRAPAGGSCSTVVLGMSLLAAAASARQRAAVLNMIADLSKDWWTMHKRG